MEVGNRIREERERLGVSQEELARRVFVSRQTVSNWETGKTYPDVQSLLLLSGLFEVSVKAGRTYNRQTATRLASKRAGTVDVRNGGTREHLTDSHAPVV